MIAILHCTYIQAFIGNVECSLFTHAILLFNRTISNNSLPSDPAVVTKRLCINGLEASSDPTNSMWG
jgi:hypothetical protein